MSAIEAYAELRRFGRPVLTTEDAATRLGASLSASSRLLARLAAAGLVVRLRRGLWSLEEDLDPLALGDYVAAPFPAYVSFQSALHLHGMVEQIPRVVYLASPGPTRRTPTSLATFSVHCISPRFFGGFATTGDPPIRVATPEKALMDTLYLSCAKSRLFARLPELELPAGFRVREARRWLGRIASPARRVMVERRLQTVLEEARGDAVRGLEQQRGRRPAGAAGRGARR